MFEEVAEVWDCLNDDLEYASTETFNLYAATCTDEILVDGDPAIQLIYGKILKFREEIKKDFQPYLDMRDQYLKDTQL